MLTRTEVVQRERQVNKIDEEVKRRFGTLSSKKARGVYRKMHEALSMKRLGNARVVRGGGASPR